MMAQFGVSGPLGRRWEVPSHCGVPGEAIWIDYQAPRFPRPASDPAQLPPKIRAHELPFRSTGQSTRISSRRILLKCFRVERERYRGAHSLRILEGRLAPPEGGDGTGPWSACGGRSTGSRLQAGIQTLRWGLRRYLPLRPFHRMEVPLSSFRPTPARAGVACKRTGAVLLVF
jgi:hypothetical protein